jgi:hypothetical protein
MLGWLGVGLAWCRAGLPSGTLVTQPSWLRDSETGAQLNTLPT